MTLTNRKLFAGAHMRNIRNEHKLTQKDCAQRLGISTSYLNQIENNQRPLSASVILSLVEEFNTDITKFKIDDSDRRLTDLREIMRDPIFGTETPSLQELKIATSNTPEFAKAFVTLHNAYQSSQDQLAAMDDVLQREDLQLRPQPYDEVRDFFHYMDNYIEWLDRCAESFAEDLEASKSNALDKLVERFATVHKISVLFEVQSDVPPTLRSLEAKSSKLYINPSLPTPSQVFQLLAQIAILEESEAIEKILDDGNFSTPEARAIAKLGLANYFAGAAMMPYARFLNKARELRHDLELLSDHFGASLEQVAHRLSTLNRMGAKGVPFFFLRVDRAGTITKRHSSTRLQFARFGGACPLWNVHQAFEKPGEYVRQLAVTPDGEKYFSLARTVTKRARGFNSVIRRYSIGLGCSIKHAGEVVYADGLDFDASEDYCKIGISCRICERTNCPQRSVPPIGKSLSVDFEKRNVVPFNIDPN